MSAGAPADAPWRQAVEAQIAGASADARRARGDDPRHGREPLDQRLQREGGDVEGWIQLAPCSRMVLGERGGGGTRNGQQRATLLVSGVALLGVAAGLVLYALNDSIVFFYTPSEALTRNIAEGQRFRLGGLVEKGSSSMAPMRA